MYSSYPMFSGVQDQGIQLTVDGVAKTFHRSLSVVSADNLASQELGGYKALNAALRKCRCCMITDEDMQIKVCC